MTEKRFSIRLANGSTQAFDSASQLASWTRSQYELQKVPASATRRVNRSQKHRTRDKVQLVDGALPLAKYNRHRSCSDGSSE